MYGGAEGRVKGGKEDTAGRQEWGSLLRGAAGEGSHLERG